MLDKLDFESEATEGTTSTIFVLEPELEIELEMELELELGAEGGLMGTASARRASGPQFGGIFCPSFLQFAWAADCTHVPAALHSSAVWALPHDAQSCRLPHEAWSAARQTLPGQQYPKQYQAAPPPRSPRPPRPPRRPPPRPLRSRHSP